MRDAQARRGATPALGRWFAKKAARRLVAGLPRTGRGGPNLRVLTYHRFAARSRDPFAVAPELFDAQMARLAASGRAVDLPRLLAFVGGDPDAVPDHAILVTIDDGALSTLTVAAPILARHRVPAVAFVSAGRLGEPADDGPERFLDRHEVASLPDYGIEIGSHAVDHVSLGGLDRHRLQRALGGSKVILEDLTGREITAFAYPFGTRLDFDDCSRREAALAGYRVCFTSQHGAVGRGSDPLLLPRIKIEGGDPMIVFDRALVGGLDAWILIDRALSGWQATERGRLQPKAR